VPGEPRKPRPVVATAIAVAMLVLGLLVALARPGEVLDELTLTLLVLAAVAEALAARYATRLTVSGAFVAGMLAVGFLGAAAAFLIPIVGHGTVWLLERYRWRALLINLAGSATPTAIAAAAFHAVDPGDEGAAFILLLALATVLTLAMNATVVPALSGLLHGRPILQSIGTMRAFLPAFALNTGLVAVIAELYAEGGFVVLLFALLNILAFSYMARLVVTARERTREYAALSWGVLSGLIRTLDERDSRAARHCAAVAAFSRDIAREVGMSKRDQELAHTAGLLHDIGKFALSDRVMERGGRLEESDWRGIRRHPEIGAELLRDIGVFGPVAQIVRAHHERLDGRGYPDGLTGDEIPPIARIVAVAEVYDTLTAPDTYRTPLTSFEALNELRRVTGSQLDGEYVEILARLLAGRGTDYRHADEADFDRELDIERRMAEATAAEPG
jgi:putative nucleotidyltransferase with HDIG domain